MSSSYHSPEKPQQDAASELIPGIFTAPWWRLVLAGVAVLLIGAFFLFLFSELLSILLTVILAVAIAASLDPLVNILERKMPRGVAVVLVFLALALLFGLALWIIFPPLIQQATDIIEQIPTFIAALEDIYTELAEEDIELIPLLENIVNQAGALARGLAAVPLGIFSGLFAFFLLLFITIYTLLEAPSIRRFFLSLYPVGQRERADQVSQKMVGAMGGFVRGSAIIAFIVGLTTYIGLTLIGVPFALALGVLAGILEFLPYIGPFLAAIPIVLVALIQSPTQAIIVLIFFIIVQEIEANILVPKIQKTQTKLSPLITLLALSAGSILGGLVGVLAAIPFAAAVSVFVEEVVAPEIRRRTGAAAHPMPEETEKEDGEEE
jgi:predicted PurR-regulated permease PerM